VSNVETTDGPQPAHKKHPRGACWCAWYFDHGSVINAAERLDTTDECAAWIGKLNELDADPAKIEAVIDRLHELR